MKGRPTLYEKLAQLPFALGSLVMMVILFIWDLARFIFWAVGHLIRPGIGGM